jgi:hypothetical protein
MCCLYAVFQGHSSAVSAGEVKPAGSFMNDPV